MLDGADHHVAASRQGGRAEQTQGIGLGSATREYHLRRLCPQQGGHLAARLFQRTRRSRAQTMRRGWIGIEVRHRMHHRRQDFGQGRSGSGVVEVDDHRKQTIMDPRRREGEDAISPGSLAVLGGLGAQHFQEWIRTGARTRRAYSHERSEAAGASGAGTARRIAT